MTREEAKELLLNISAYDIDMQRGMAKQEAIEMAIQALEQEPCEDAISRQAALDALSTWDKFGCDADTKLVPYKDHYIPYIHYDDVIKCINGLPSVSTEKTGQWIESNGVDMFVCSVCNDSFYPMPTCMGKPMFKYCPCCGAKMV